MRELDIGKELVIFSVVTVVCLDSSLVFGWEVQSVSAGEQQPRAMGPSSRLCPSPTGEGWPDTSSRVLL